MAERDVLDIEDLAAFQIVRSLDERGQHDLVAEAISEAQCNLPWQLTTNSLPLARNLLLRNHGVGLYSKIGFLEDIQQGLLRYITILSPVLKDRKMGVLTSSRSHPNPAIHLMCRSLSKALKAMKLDS